jgi:hypothetical protein
MKKLTILLVLFLSIGLTSCVTDHNPPKVVETKQTKDIMTVFNLTGDTLEVIELLDFYIDDSCVRGTRKDGTDFYTTLPYLINENR